MLMRAYLFIVFIVILSGCATQGVSTQNYLEPSHYKVNNEMVVNDNYSDVWDKLVKELSKSFYVINNIDKESRIINISFSTNTPEDYIDCGTTHRTYEKGKKTLNFNYKTASNSKFILAAEKQLNPSFSYYFKINRRTNLEGRSNIYIAPVNTDVNKTNVTVNTRYILSIVAGGDSYVANISGATLNQVHLQDKTYSVTLNTKKPGRSNWGDGQEISCVSKGTLEEEILGIVK